MDPNQGEDTIIQSLLNRLAAGDDSARGDLISHANDRLYLMARKHLRHSPAVRRWNETGDVLQNALMRLNRALNDVQPDSTRQFIGLAALQIRRESKDLARHHFGPQGDGRHHASDPGFVDSQGRRFSLNEQAVDGETAGGLSTSEMERFHDAVGELPDDLREVFERSFYLNMTQEEIARDIGVAARTIKRRFRAAKLQLAEMLEDAT